MNQFVVQNTPADVTFSLKRKPALSEPKGVLISEDRHQRVFALDTARRVYYRDTDVPPWNRENACLSFDSRNPDSYSLEIRIDTPKTGERLLLSYMMMERIMHLHHRTILHASWVVHKGQALLFSGPSGIGKSTQAELWKTHRAAEIINGDKVGLIFADDGIKAAGIPLSGSSTYCKDRTMPVRAIVMLGQARENTIVRLKTGEAFRLLAAQMPVQVWCREDIEAIMQYAQLLAEKVPVYLLRCTKDERAVELLEQTLCEEEEEIGIENIPVSAHKSSQTENSSERNI